MQTIIVFNIAFHDRSVVFNSTSMTLLIKEFGDTFFTNIIIAFITSSKGFLWIVFIIFQEFHFTTLWAQIILTFFTVHKTFFYFMAEAIATDATHDTSYIGFIGFCWKLLHIFQLMAIIASVSIGSVNIDCFAAITFMTGLICSSFLYSKVVVLCALQLVKFCILHIYNFLLLLFFLFNFYHINVHNHFLRVFLVFILDVK